jgi:recombination protein RecA
MGDSHVGLQARLMSQALRKITGSLSKTGTAAIFINQIREKIGVMFGNPERSRRPRASSSTASVRLDVRRVETLKTAPTWSAFAPRERSSKTRSRPRSSRPSSTSCSARASRARVRSLISGRNWN